MIPQSLIENKPYNIFYRILSFLKNPRNKKIIGLFFCLLIIGSLVPIYYTNAILGWLTRPIKFVTNLPLIIPAVFVGLLVTVATGITMPFVGLVGELLKWAAQGKIAVVSLTNPAGTSTLAANPILQAGLNVTMPLANMLIILGFVVIAIGTILGIESYGLRKTLPILIIMAVLINFAPVLVGIVVDFSNLIMGYFADAFDFTDLGSLTANVIGDTWGSLWDSLTNKYIWEQFNPKSDNSFLVTMIQIGGQAAAVFAFNIFGALAMLLVFALLVVRVIMIWILVILSPLAFASYIIPATRNYLRKWWDNLLQWAFIGVVATFFLYLATQVLKNADSIVGAAPSGDLGPQAGWISGLIQPLLKGVFPLVIMLIGFFASMSSGAMFSGSVIKGAKLLGAKISNWGQEKAGGFLTGQRNWRLGFGKEGATGIRRAIPSFRRFGMAEEVGQRSIIDQIERMGLNFSSKERSVLERAHLGGKWGGRIGALPAAYATGGLNSLAYLMRKGSPEVGAILHKRLGEANDKANKKYELLKNNPALLRAAAEGGNAIDRSAAGLLMAKEGHLEQLKENQKLSLLQRIAKSLETVNQSGRKELNKIYPAYLPNCEKSAQGMVPEDVKKMAQSNIFDKNTGAVQNEFVGHMINNFDEERMTALAKRRDRREVVPVIKNYIRENGGIQGLRDSGRDDLANYFEGNGQRYWGEFGGGATGETGTPPPGGGTSGLENVPRAEPPPTKRLKGGWKGPGL